MTLKWAAPLALFTAINTAGAANFHYNHAAIAAAETKTDAGDEASRLMIEGTWAVAQSGFLGIRYVNAETDKLGQMNVDTLGLTIKQHELVTHAGLKNELGTHTDLYYGLQLGVGKFESNNAQIDDTGFEHLGIFLGARQWIVRGYLEADVRYTRVEGKFEEERFKFNDLQVGTLGYLTPNFALGLHLARSFGSDDDRDAVMISFQYDY